MQSRKFGFHPRLSRLNSLSSWQTNSTVGVENMQKTVSQGWLYATVILAFAVSSLAWERHQTSKALKKAFYYSYHVTVQDSETGEILNATIEHPVLSTTDLFAQTTGTLAYPDGSVRIGGVAYTPRTYTFGLLGYQAEHLIISPDSPFTDKVLIELKRIPNTKENNNGRQGGAANPSGG